MEALLLQRQASHVQVSDCVRSGRQQQSLSSSFLCYLAGVKVVCQVTMTCKSMQAMHIIITACGRPCGIQCMPVECTCGWANVAHVDMHAGRCGRAVQHAAQSASLSFR